MAPSCSTPAISTPANASTVGVEFAAQKSNLLLQGEYENFEVTRSDAGDHGPAPTSTATMSRGCGPSPASRASTQPRQTAATSTPPWSAIGRSAGRTLVLGRLGSRRALFGHGPELSRGGRGRGRAGGRHPRRRRAGRQRRHQLSNIPNAVMRFMFDYQHVRIDRLSPATVANAGTIWFTPVGAQIGQTYDAVALRSQFALLDLRSKSITGMPWRSRLAVWATGSGRSFFAPRSRAVSSVRLRFPPAPPRRRMSRPYAPPTASPGPDRCRSPGW